MTLPVVTLDDLRTFATAQSLALTDADLQARLDAGSTSNSLMLRDYIAGFFPELTPQDIQ